MIVFTNVIYNASLHRKYTTRSNKFLTKIFAVVMQSCLTFAMTKVKIKLLSHFFPNFHGWLSGICSSKNNFGVHICRMN